MHTFWKTTLTAAFLVAQAACAAASERASSVVLFPVTLSAPTKVGGDAVKSGEVFYQQELRSTEIVKLKSDLTLHYRARSRLLGEFGVGSNNAFTLKAGQMFVIAYHGDGYIYCSTVSDKLDDSLGRIYEIIVCLKDRNQNGTFSRALAVESYPYRARVPYEIPGIWREDWLPVTAETEQVSPGEIPFAQMSMRYEFEKTDFLSPNFAAFVGKVCWPKELMSATAGANAPCGMPDWFTDASINANISPKPNAKETVVKKDVTVFYERHPDGSMKIDVTRPLPAGLAAVIPKSWITVNDNFQVTEFRGSTIIVRIAPVSIDDAGVLSILEE